MRQVMREHYFACGRVYAFLATHAQRSGGEKGFGDDDPAFLLTLMECPHSCRRRTAPFEEGSLHPCRQQCEMKQLFLDGWRQGEAQAHHIYETGDLLMIEDIGRAAGFTSRRPPRNYSRHYAEQDGFDAHLHGEALKRFLLAWRETGGDRRRRKGV